MGYFDVDPGGPDRDLVGIPRGLLFEGYAIYEIDDRRTPKPEPFATQKMVSAELDREKVWVERINKGLIICGAAPTFSVASRLIESGFSVDVIIYMGPTLTDLKSRFCECNSNHA